MANVATATIITCDRVVRGKPCGEPARTYRVSEADDPAGAWEIDLCDKHANALFQQVTREGRRVADTRRQTFEYGYSRGLPVVRGTYIWWGG